MLRRYRALVSSLMIVLLCGTWLVGCGATAATVGRTLIGGADSAIITAAFSADGAALATANPDHSITIWDVASGRARQTLKGHTAEVTTLTFSADGKLLASGGMDQRVELWDVAAGKELRALSGGTGVVNTVAFSPDGRILASGGQDGAVRLWEVASGSQKQSLAASNGGVTSLAYSPDGKALASGGRDASVQVWDTGSNQLTRRLSGHKDAVSALAFSPDSRSLASGGDDRQVKLWSVQDGQERHTLTGHGGGIDALSFAPDGKSLASGSDDRTAKIWDAATGQVRQTLAGHAEPVPAVAFSPDGQSLLSGSRDNSAKQWDVATGQLQRSINVRPVASASPVAPPSGTPIAGPPGTIVPGGPTVRVALTRPGEQARLTLVGTAGQHVSVVIDEMTLAESDLIVQAPDGTTLTSRYYFQRENFLDDIALPSTGTYVLLFAGRNGATGTANFTAYTYAHTTGTITPGGAAVPVTTTIPGQNAHVTFAGQTGQLISVRVAGMTVEEADLVLIGPTGDVVKGLYMFQPSTFLDAVALPADGTYTLSFDPRTAMIGGATLTAYVVQDTTGGIAPGGPAVPVSATVPGQNVRLALQGTAGQRISVKIESLTAEEADLVLLAPDGTTVQGRYIFQAESFFDAVALPVTGAYTLVFDPRNDLAGSARLTMYNVVDRQGQIAVGGAAVQVAIDTPGQNARLTFAGTAGRPVTVTLDPLAIAEGDITILSPDGTKLAGAYFFQAGQALAVTLPAGGTYVLVCDPRGAEVGTVGIALK